MSLRKATRARGVAKRPRLEVSVTVDCNGSDLDMKYFPMLAAFLDDECLSGLLSVERGGALLHLHLQAVFCLHAKTVVKVKKRISARLGWLTDTRPVGCKVCVKKLTNRGLHSFVGMVGYCMKDQGEVHHQVRMKDVPDSMVSDGLERFTLLGAADTKNRVELTSSNLLYNEYRSRHPLGTSLRSCLRSMIVSGKYAPCARWLMHLGIHDARADSLWRCYIHPDSISTIDIDNVFFWHCAQRTIPRYFEEAEAGTPGPVLPIEELETDSEHHALLEFMPLSHILSTSAAGPETCMASERIEIEPVAFASFGTASCPIVLD